MERHGQWGVGEVGAGRGTAILALVLAAWWPPDVARGQALTTAPVEEGCIHPTGSSTGTPSGGSGEGGGAARCLCECEWEFEITRESEESYDSSSWSSCYLVGVQTWLIHLRSKGGDFHGHGYAMDSCWGSATGSGSVTSNYQFRLKLINKCPCCRGKIEARGSPRFKVILEVDAGSGTAVASAGGHIIEESTATEMKADVQGSMELAADSSGVSLFIKSGDVGGVTSISTGGTSTRRVRTFIDASNDWKYADAETLDVVGTAHMAVTADASPIALNPYARAQARLPSADSRREIEVIATCVGGCEVEYTVTVEE